MSFAINLRYLRQKKGWSQDKLADYLGYKSFTTIQKWETDKAEPNIKTLKILSALFDVSMDDFLNKDLTVSTDSGMEDFKIKFNSAEDAILFVLKTASMENLCGYTLENISENELKELAKQITNYAAFISQNLSK